MALRFIALSVLPTNSWFYLYSHGWHDTAKAINEHSFKVVDNFCVESGLLLCFTMIFGSLDLWCIRSVMYPIAVIAKLIPLLAVAHADLRGFLLLNFLRVRSPLATMENH